MAAIQAGYVDDGLDIIKHIQLLNLRNGWTWTQNLWRPGELTYVTAPASWFITDVLDGSALDVPSGTLFLSPILRPEESVNVYPVYFPGFWATVRADRKTHSLKFEITRVFGNAGPALKHVVVCPVGVPTTDQRVIDIPEFSVREGAVLDLSSHWDDFDKAIIQKPVLPNADDVPYLEVPLSSLLH